VIFKPKVPSRLSSYITVVQDFQALKIRELTLNTEDEKEYLAELRNKPGKYFIYKINGDIFWTVSRDTQDGFYLEKIVEIKLFTVPESDVEDILVSHLQKKALIDHFSV